MYMRMAFLMLISFYTSRVILNSLGVEDFGTYNLVGSVVAMFSSLKTIFSASTQRFLNYEMGKGNYSLLKCIFNSSIIVNIVISIVFVLLVEIVGLWFLNTQINVAPDRLFAAKVVFHLSVLSAVISIVTTSFDAEIIANEKMSFFAVISIFEGLLKLGSALLLSYITCDRLLLYGLLMLVVPIVVLGTDIIYCRRNFVECRLSFNYNKDVFTKMLKFAGWNFLGTNAYVLSQNGLNMVLNVFGGPIVNAARGIAYQINGALNQVVTNVAIVFNPFCIKTYASGDTEKAFELSYLITKLLFLVQYSIVTTLIIFTPELLFVWLGQVPDYSVVFIRLTLLYVLIRTLHPTIDVLLKAGGDIKMYQISEGVLLVCPLVASYIILLCGYGYYHVFILMILFDFINHINLLFIAQKKIGLNVIMYFKRVFFFVIPLLVWVVLILVLFPQTSLISHKLSLLFISYIFAFILILIGGLNKTEIQTILSLIKNK